MSRTYFSSIKLFLPELEVDALHGGLCDHVPLAPGLGDGHGGGGGKGSLTNENRVLLKRSGNIKLLTEQSIEIDGDYFDKGPAEIFVKKGSIQLKI